MRRCLAILSLVSFGLAGSISAGAPAAAAGACKKAKPAVPESRSTGASDAVKEKVIAVTERATAEKPITIEFSHGPALVDEFYGETTTGDPRTFMLIEDARFFNFQLTGKAKYAALNIALEWVTPSASDIDLHLYGPSGALLEKSGAYNPYEPAMGAVGLGGDDDMGLEQIRDRFMDRCSAFTVESRPTYTAGEDVVLKVWID